VEYVDTKKEIATIFTKPLPMSTFAYLRQKLGVISISNSIEQASSKKDHMGRGSITSRVAEKCYFYH
jgi:hypothetical protein